MTRNATLAQRAPDATAPAGPEALTRLEWHPPGALKPNPDNPRRHPARQIKAIGHSLSSFGFRAPVVCRPDLTIIIGHGRTLAAIELGLPRVPVIVAEGLTDEQARALALMDNHLAGLSEYDPTKLRKEVQGLAEAGVDLKAFEFTLGAPPGTPKAEGADGGDDGPLVEDVGVEASFWIAVEGPFAEQAAALDALKRLHSIPGVTVHSNLIVS